MSTASEQAQAPAPPRWTRFLGDLARPAEQSRSLRAATLVATMAAAVAVLTNDVGGALLWTLVLVVIPVGAVASYLRRNDTNPVVPIVLTLITIGLVIRFLTANDNPASPGELRVPLAELLVMLEAVRSFALRSRRELRFALASSLALISVAGALALSMSFAAYAAIWGAGAALALMLAYRSELTDVHRPAPGLRRGAPMPVRALVAAIVAVGALGTVAFLVVPAAKSSRLLAFSAKLPRQISVPTPGGLSNPSLGRDDPGRPGDEATGPAPKSFGYFGFADRLDTSVRGRPDDTLVMRVRSSAPDFWRGQTFDVWDGRTWTLSDSRTAVVSNGSPLQLLQPAGEPPVPGQELIQTFSLEISGPNLIFAASQPTQVYIPQAAVFETTDGAVRTGVELEKGAVYTVVSRRPLTTAARLRATGDSSQTVTPPELAQRYTRLAAIPDRVSKLAAQLTQGQASTYDKVLAIEAWMADNTQYSLDIPPLPAGEDAVERFLFVDRIGFCEQIASSLVVMLRSQGIPTRLAVGYTPGERNPFTGFYEVRARDAHAWAEVYFPGIGWQAFDPTAQVPLSGDAPPDAARVGLRDYLSRHLPDLSSPLGMVVTLSAFAAALALWRRQLRELWQRLHRRRHRTWAQLQLARLEKIGTDLGRQRLPGETPVEYAAALQRTVLRDPAAGQVAAAITADGFDDGHLSDGERRVVEQRLAALSDRTS